MADYILSCCSTADLDLKTFLARDIHYACFHYMLNGVMYDDDLGQSMSYDQFYAKLSEGAETRTSQVNAAEFIAYFTPFLKEGKDILHVCLSSGLSGVYNSACIARDELSEKFPERKIYIVDSLCASSGYGLLMDTLADMRDEGKPIEELRDFVVDRRQHLHHWFFSTDLSMYVKGGRISKTAGMFGTMLKICPVLNVNTAGCLIPRLKCRGKRKAITEMVDQMEAHAEGGNNYSGKCFLSHSDCLQDALSVVELIVQRFPLLKEKPRIFTIGTTIGSHTGPGTVALYFWGDLRTE